MNTKSMPSYILRAYQFSETFRNEVFRIAGPEAEDIPVGDLRRKSLLGKLRFLRSLCVKAVLYLPLEDPQSESILPLLLALGAVSSVARLAVIRADGSVRYVSKISAISSVLRVAFGTIAGLFAASRCRFSALRLLHQSHQETKPIQSSKRVLYINGNYWFGIRIGGSVGHIAGVVNSLSQMGYSVDLASGNPQPMIHPSINEIAIEPLEAHGYPLELNVLRFHYRIFDRLRRLKGNQYRFIYQRMSLLNFAGVALSRLWGVPLLLEYNGSEVWIARNWGRSLRFSKLGVALEDVCLRHAHRVVVVSRALADEVTARGVDPCRVVCYPNCVDPTHFSGETVTESTKLDIRKRFGISSGEVLIAFVGTFGRWHGAPILAEAIKSLTDHHSDWLQTNRVRFAMIGDGAMMPQVRSLIGGSDYSRWVCFTGLVPQSETVNYLAACDVLISPHVSNADGSRFFGSPTKLFEYMAMEKGIIASDLDQIGEVLANGVKIWMEKDASGLAPLAVLVRPGNVHDLTRAITCLVEDPDLRRVLGENARAEVLRKYTWSHHVTSILRSLSDLQIEGDHSATALTDKNTVAIS